jgi:Na+/H+ antiporter NhaD/arsenite permease-like protein
MNVLLVFAAGYLLISARRLPLLPMGRPAGALAGAVMMVAAGVFPTAEAAARKISLDTLGLLLGTMLISAHLAEAGFFSAAADLIIRRSGSPAALLRAVVFSSGLLSALLVNDTVCVMMTPLLVAVLVRTRLPAAPYLLALATSSNVGSAMALTGNPQNMLIGISSGIGFLRFLVHLAPGAILGLWVNWRLLLWYYGRQLPAGPLSIPPAVPDAATVAPAPLDRPLLIKSLLALAVMVGLFCALPSGWLAWSALGAAVLLLALAGREANPAFARVDWPLLVFFAGLFVMVGGLEEAGLTARAYEAVRPLLSDSEAGLANFSWFTLVGSNLFSNVPFVSVVGRWMGNFEGNAVATPELMWLMLALVSTLAGNLTLIGSVANIIVAESARDHYPLGFWEYLRFGVVSTLATGLVGLLGLRVMHVLLAG